jgi:hypothetical protein
MRAFSRRSLRLALLVVLGLAAAAPAPAQNDPASRRAAIEAIYPVMIAALEAKSFGSARRICEQAIVWEPQNPVHHYNLACIEAQAGNTRLPHAWGALELALALGFDDAEHLQSDPDLAPLHGNPRFAELVRKAAQNAIAGDALSSLAIPAPRAPLPDAVPDSPPVDAPAPARIEAGLPVGLYFMTRYLPATRALEQEVWYFDPDRTVYRDLEYGFSRQDLAAHAGRKGRARSDGAQLEVRWADGATTRAAVESDHDGFAWDMGLFVRVSAFTLPSDPAGTYRGTETVGTDDASSGWSRHLELRPDGTFHWDAIALRGREAGRATVAASDQPATGTWELQGYSLVLTDSQGHSLRRIAFPDDDSRTVLKPDRMFFGGWMLRRQP